MASRKTITLAAAALALIASTLVAAPPIPTTPAPVDGILYARPFRLDTSFKHQWQKEQPAVEAGYLLVLKVNPDLVFPRQRAEPVLYVGGQVARRVNVGYESGHVVVIVPSKRDAKGDVALDLTKTRIWFGTPELPERIDVAKIREERTRAVEANITPLPRTQVDRAIRSGREGAVALEDQAHLIREAAQLVRVYSPQERELADNLAATRTPPKDGAVDK